MTSGRAPLVSREPELETLQCFLASDGGPGCLVLSGEPGIGKTTLWESGLTMAETSGYRALSARANEAEAALSFAALADLVEGVEPMVLATLPSPQLHALEVALRRADPVGAGPEPLAISTGFLNVLRALADLDALVIAIDDVQWLDQPSADALLFAGRRLLGRNARFLLSRRTGRPSSLERVLQPSGVQVLEIGALSFGAISRLLSERLGLVPSRRLLRQVFDTAQGNPLFALELGRMIVEGGPPEVGADLPTPELDDELLGARVSGLPAAVRRALLAVALSAGLSRAEVSALVGPLAVDEAVAAGLLVVERSGARPSHPMLAAAARHHSTAAERQALHLELAATVSDPMLRARHLAMAVEGPDEAIAATVEAAALGAVERGAVQDAEELAAHALRLTPVGSARRPERLLALARLHSAAGDLASVTDLLSNGMAELAPGRARAFAHLLLGEGAPLPQEEAHLELALAEAGDDPGVRAITLARRSVLLSANRVERIDEAEDLARQALVAARAAGGDVDHRALHALAWATALGGRPVDDLSELAPTSPVGTSLYDTSVERIVAVRLAFRGQLDQARVIFHRLLELADERGEVRSRLVLEVQLGELELRSGDVRKAALFLQEVDHWAALGEMSMVHARLQALLAAVTGVPEDVKRWATVALRPGELLASPGWDRLEVRRALGIAALLQRDTAGALDNLGAVWQHTVNEHVEDPGAFPVAADLVDVLVESGDVGAASDVTERLRRLSVAQGHPWGLVTARRCGATVRAAGRYDDDTGQELMTVAADYAQLGLNFDRARSLLVLGRLQRRAKKRAEARRTLAEAEAGFDEIGCSGWADEVRLEAARVSGRRSAGGNELTSSERRVAELAASGLSNKEIAGLLFVGVYTVEAHLSHVYAKLGVRSRTQLALRVSPSS